MIDATIIRAHACATGYKKMEIKKCFDMSSGGFSTKIHMMCDGLGNHLEFILRKGHFMM